MVIKVRKKLGIILIAVTSLFATACGASIPEMSEEQNAQVVEYAAGLLLKYDENYHSRLQEEEPVEAEAVQTEEQSVPEEQPVPEEPVAETPTEQEADEPVVVNNSEEPEEVTYNSIEEFYGLDGLNIAYTGYELKDMYPDSAAQTDGEDADMFFAMTATPGSKLLVLHFNVTNTSGQEKNLDMMSVGSKYKISINGETPKYALTTMLTNDLATYMGTLGTDAVEDMVLVSEIKEEKTSDIQSISLMMKNASENATISLN